MTYSSVSQQQYEQYLHQQTDNTYDYNQHAASDVDLQIQHYLGNYFANTPSNITSNMSSTKGGSKDGLSRAGSVDSKGKSNANNSQSKPTSFLSPNWGFTQITRRRHSFNDQGLQQSQSKKQDEDIREAQHSTVTPSSSHSSKRRVSLPVGTEHLKHSATEASGQTIKSDAKYSILPRFSLFKLSDARTLSRNIRKTESTPIESPNNNSTDLSNGNSNLIHTPSTRLSTASNDSGNSPTFTNNVTGRRSSIAAGSIAESHISSSAASNTSSAKRAVETTQIWRNIKKSLNLKGLLTLPRTKVRKLSLRRGKESENGEGEVNDGIGSGSGDGSGGGGSGESCEPGPAMQGGESS
jgi:hypothetical protein